MSPYGASDFEEYFGMIQAPEELFISNLQCGISLHGRQTKQLNEQRDINQNMLDLVSTKCNNLGTVEVRCSQFNVHDPLHRAFHDTHPRSSPYAIFYNTLVFLR